jgi:CDP-4-dehydro-6-deoxyglucose reductase, E1
VVALAVVVGTDHLVADSLVNSFEANGWSTVTVPYEWLDEPGSAEAIAELRPSVVLLAPCAVDPLSGEHAAPSATQARVAAAGRGAATAGARLVLYSTEAVFDGKLGPYSENDKPTPEHETGRQALASEEAALAAPCRPLVIRTSLVFGWARESENLAMRLWSRLGAGQPLAVDQALRTPTLAEHLAEITVRLLEAEADGVIHVAGGEHVSSYDFATRVARTFLMDPELVRPTPSPQRYGLASDRLTELLSTPPLPLREALQRVRRRWRGETQVFLRHTTAPRDDDLKRDILERVRVYARAVHGAGSFVPFTSPVPYSGRVFGEEELVNLVDASLDFWLTLGPWGDGFEAGLKRRLGARDVVLTNSGSSANLTAVAALCSNRLSRPLLPGDEVITPAATFPTTLAPLLQHGLTPVLVDCELGTYNINPDLVRAAVTERTRALMIPHTLGNPCDLDAMVELAEQHSLYLVEDACDALGSTFRGQPVGTFGTLGTLSFYPAHQITTGEGGAVIVNEARLTRIVRSVRDWGRECWCAPGESNTCGKRFGWQVGDLPAGYDHKFTYSDIGYNLKPTDLQAAIGVAQLNRLDHFVDRRRSNFRRLYEAMEEHRDHVILPRLDERAQPAWFGFPLTVKDDSKRELVQWLQRSNIDTRELFAGSILRQPGYQKAAVRVHGELTETDRMLRSTFFVGVYPGLTDEMIDFMIERMHAFFRGQR